MVSKVLPQFDANSRTLKVRLELDNPGYVLRPDMFVDVEFPVTLPPALTVPADAILDSGLRKTVFVDRGNGFFEPREVETGWRLGNRVEITKGLEAWGEDRHLGQLPHRLRKPAGDGGRRDGWNAEQRPGLRRGCLCEQGRESREGKAIIKGKTYYFCFR